MRRKTVLAGVALAVSAAFGIASPAGAQPLCFGPSTAYVCADPTGSSITQCIYAGPPPCHTVTVPVPTAYCGGILAYVCAVSSG